MIRRNITKHPVARRFLSAFEAASDEVERYHGARKARSQSKSIQCPECDVWFKGYKFFYAFRCPCCRAIIRLQPPGKLDRRWAEAREEIHEAIA